MASQSSEKWNLQYSQPDRLTGMAPTHCYAIANNCWLKYQSTYKKFCGSVQTMVSIPTGKSLNC